MSRLNEINAAFSTTIANSHANIITRVAVELAEVEMQRRVALLIKGMNIRDALGKQKSKIQPDQIAYNGTGEVVTRTYSSAKIAELKKTDTNIARIEEVIDRAINDANYDSLEKTVNELSKDAGKKSDNE